MANLKDFFLDLLNWEEQKNYANLLPGEIIHSYDTISL